MIIAFISYNPERTPIRRGPEIFLAKGSFSPSLLPNYCLSSQKLINRGCEKESPYFEQDYQLEKI